MKRVLFGLTMATALIAGIGFASAQPASTTTTTTTWSDDEGAALNTYSTTQKYTAVNDAAMQPTVGAVLPETVTFYPLPETMKVPDSANYSYTIINHRPVVVERTTRKVVHTWSESP